MLFCNKKIYRLLRFYENRKFNSIALWFVIKTSILRVSTVKNHLLMSFSGLRQIHQENCCQYDKQKSFCFHLVQLYKTWWKCKYTKTSMYTRVPFRKRLRVHVIRVNGTKDGRLGSKISEKCPKVQK